MKAARVSLKLKTGDISLLSNLTSVTANIKRISRLEAVERDNEKNPAAIHVDFQIKPHQEHLPMVLGETEELDLVIGLDDAVEIGLLMLAMGLEDKSGLEVDEVFKRLFELTCELHS